jgi:ectoine utilization protein EutC
MAHDIRIATESQLRQVVELDIGIIDTIETAFRQLATGQVVMPPILSMAMKDVNAEVDVKTAYVPGFEGFAIKVSPGFFNNPSIGLPSLNGLMILLSAKTGLVQAVFLDNGYLTDIRTAAAGAVAARHLAPKTVDTIGVLGTGVQARLQVLAAAKVRPVKRILIWGRDQDKSDQLAQEMSLTLACEAAAVSNPAELVAASQLVITTTPATSPILDAAALHPGLHITAMGSDQEDKNELAVAVATRADLFVCDRISQCEKLGELRSVLEAGVFQDTTGVAELGDIVAGKTAGRTHEDQITICDLTGTGVQDTAIATLAFDRITKSDLGTLMSV